MHLLVPVLRDKPAGRLGQPEHQHHEQDGEDALAPVGDAPAVVPVLQLHRWVVQCHMSLVIYIHMCIYIIAGMYLEPDVERTGEEDAGSDGELLDGHHQAPHLRTFHLYN